MIQCWWYPVWFQIDDDWNPISWYVSSFQPWQRSYMTVGEQHMVSLHTCGIWCHWYNFDHSKKLDYLCDQAYIHFIQKGCYFHHGRWNYTLARQKSFGLVVRLYRNMITSSLAHITNRQCIISNSPSTRSLAKSE